MAGILECPRCKARTEADSIEEGRKRLNHAIGIYLGKPCYDGLVELRFTSGKKTATKKTLKNLKDDKSTKSDSK